MTLFLAFILIVAAFVAGGLYHDNVRSLYAKVMRKAEGAVPIVNGRILGCEKSFSDWLREKGSLGSFPDDISAWLTAEKADPRKYTAYVEKVRL